MTIGRLRRCGTMRLAATGRGSKRIKNPARKNHLGWMRVLEPSGVTISWSAFFKASM